MSASDFATKVTDSENKQDRIFYLDLLTKQVRDEGAKEVLVYLASLYDGLVETDIWREYFPEEVAE